MQPNTRLVAMDVLRGFALLGILIVNIQSFAMPGAAYLNPTSFGDLEGINLAVWQMTHIFADQKFMSIFSMLFGAGIILFADNATQKQSNATALHYRRTFWLLCFGLLHAYLLWYGDILFSYAMCGFWVYLMRNKSITTLLLTSFVLLFIPFAYSIMMAVSIEYFPPDALTGLKEAWAPNTEQIHKEILSYQGSFSTALEHRAEETLMMQTYVFLTLFLWRASAMMLIGMALYRSGFFQLTWSFSSYRNLALGGALLGLTTIIYGVEQNQQHQFALDYSMFMGSQFNYWGSIFLALSYASLVMLLVQSRRLKSLQNGLAAIGKTAFSQYILQTLICTTLFYGYGAGLFSTLERWQQFIVVLIIWGLQLWLAPKWLSRFAFGPLEWLWRSLTYWKWLPFSKT